jgi:PAS domain S-box-containing protein
VTSARTGNPEGLEHLNQVTEFLDQGVIVLDHSLKIVFWNRWMSGASGHAAADVMGRPLFDVFPDIAGSPRGRALERALAGEVIVFSQRFPAASPRWSTCSRRSASPRA